MTTDVERRLDGGLDSIEEDDLVQYIKEKSEQRDDDLAKAEALLLDRFADSIHSVESKVGSMHRWGKYVVTLVVTIGVALFSAIVSVALQI